MKINVLDWFKKKKSKKVDMEAVCFDLAENIYIRELAFQMCTNFVSNAVNKCELNIYNKNKREKDGEWYRWNVQPNKNQNASQFWDALINQLFYNNEALIIVVNDELYVADDFVLNDTSAFFEHTFEGVVIGDLTLEKRFYMSEVYYFKLNSRNIKSYLDQTLQMYGELINAAYSSYLVANGNKGILKIDQFAEQEEDFEKTLNQMLNDDFKKFFSNANAVMPMYNGFDYKQLDNKGTQTTTRDFRALLTDEIQITAGAIGIPHSIVTGDVQDTSKAVDEFLTFCLDSLLEMIADEITRKNYTKEQVIDGNYVNFNTNAVKHIDIIEVANSIDKLISSGFTCINDLRKICKFDLIEEEWANQFFMTKNYSTIDDLMNQLEGGVNDEK